MYANTSLDETTYNPAAINPIIIKPCATKNGFLLKSIFLVTKILDNVPSIPPTVTIKIINSGLKFELCACSATTLGSETSGITYKNKNPPNPNEKK